MKAIQVVLTDIRLIVELVLIILLIVYVQLWKYNKKTIDYYSSSEMLSKYNAKKIISIGNNKVRIIYKEKDRIKEKIVYKPQEGSVVIIQPKEEGKEADYIIKNKGFTFRPGIGMLFDFNRLYPMLDAKLLYFNRYNSGVYVYKSGAGIYVSRHLDDILPLNPLNIESFVGYSLVGGHFSIGLRSNF